MFLAVFVILDRKFHPVSRKTGQRILDRPSFRVDVYRARRKHDGAGRQFQVSKVFRVGMTGRYDGRFSQVIGNAGCLNAAVIEPLSA